jgi:hypothetical protein
MESFYRSIQAWVNRYVPATFDDKYDGLGFWWADAPACMLSQGLQPSKAKSGQEAPASSDEIEIYKYVVSVHLINIPLHIHFTLPPYTHYGYYLQTPADCCTSP